MNKKKYLTIILSLILLLTLILVANANAKEESVKNNDKLNLKIKQAKELEYNGTNKLLDKKIRKYYQDNKIIDDSKLNDLNSSEAKKLIKIIEQDMDEFDSKLINNKATNDSSSVGTMSFGDEPPSGTNNIDYTYFEDADIILVHDGTCAYGYWRHAGTYDENKDEFVSAQKNDVGNGTGVIWEDKNWYRNNYDEALGVWVVDYENEMRNEIRDMIMTTLKAQLGEPYALSSYWDTDSWYCSKLPWYGWREHWSVNLNSDGGLCVPDDIDECDETSRFAYSD